MSKTAILILLCCALSSCGVSNSDYQAVTAENQLIKSENERLKRELEECEFGADKLSAAIDKAYAERDYASARSNIALLRSRHPESPKNEQYGKLLAVVDKLEAEQQERARAEEAERVRLANIKNTGMWRVGNYVDTFGEPTNDRYITNITLIEGTFSNTATEGSPLNVKFLISSSTDISIQLYEYARNNPVKGGGYHKYFVSIQDRNGKRYELVASNYSDRLMLDKDSITLHKALMKGGEIRFVIRASSTTIYRFTIENADWYENAYRLLKAK